MSGGPVFAPRGRIIRAAEVSVLADGESFLAAARAEGEHIVAQARAEGERILAQARADGAKAGQVAVTRRMAEVTRHLDILLDQSDAWMARLVVDTVERILGQRAPQDSTLAAAATALRAFRHARRLVVRVPTGAVEWIEQGLDRDLDPALRSLVVIQPDPIMAEGRCVVASDLGSVEAGIAEQLAALRAGLERELDRGTGDG